MEFEELVLGFDVREMWFLRTPRDSSDYDEQFLLRRDIQKPLTVDTLIWASIFRSNKTVYSAADKVIATGSVSPNFEIPPPAAFGNFWFDLQDMTAFVKRHWVADQKPAWVIAVTEVMSSEDKNRLKPTCHLRPVEVDPAWILLGYDVADGNHWSALMDAAYPPSEIQTLRDEWIPHLNKYHLFTDKQQADRFADWADARDRGHAPHFVFGLYLVELLN